MLDELLTEERLVEMAGDYNRVGRLFRGRISISEFGLVELDGLMRLGYRVIVQPRVTLGYQTEDGRYCECNFCKVGRGKNTVLQNRIGEILELDVYPYEDSEPRINEMVWYTGGIEEKNIAMIVNEEDRFDDLLLKELIPPEQIDRDAELGLGRRRQDPRQLSLLC